MTTRPEVIDELRSLFKDGATPSRMIRHIVERHEGERAFHPLIQAYFREAFAVPLVRGLSPVDTFRHADLRYTFLNEQLLHEIFQNRSVWDNGAAQVNGSGSWVESLSATDDRERIRQTQERVLPELSRCWNHLTPEEQYFINMSMASANGLHETVKILARLAECLQQRINELEASATPA